MKAHSRLKERQATGHTTRESVLSRQEPQMFTNSLGLRLAEITTLNPISSLSLSFPFSYI